MSDDEQLASEAGSEHTKHVTVRGHTVLALDKT